MQDFSNVKLYFETSGKDNQRGTSTDYGLLAYALHILERTNPPLGAVMLDVGCGDGAIIKMILNVRPDLIIDGVDLSEALISTAKKTNPNSNFFVGNACELKGFKRKYDIIYSFSFFQYISPRNIKSYTHSLCSLLRANGKMFHLSVPDVESRVTHIADGQFKKRNIVAWFTVPLIVFLNIVRGNRYDHNGYWHSREKVRRLLRGGAASVKTYDSNIYYRFDIEIQK